MTDKEKIRAEIERLTNNHDSALDYEAALEDVRNFIDSLQEPMENMKKALYQVNTRGCGMFYVVASSFDYAADEVTRELNAQQHGYSGDRVVTDVKFICREAFMQNGKRALYGDNNENHLIIVKED